METLRQVIAGGLAALLVSIAAPALAQAGRDGRAGLQVDDFDVEQVVRLDAGSPLRFSLFGTPGAMVALRIEGAQHDLVLQEVEPGVYEGTYTVLSGDRIGPAGRVVATLRRGSEWARAMLQEPLVIGAAAPAPDPGLAAPPVVADRALAGAPLAGAPFADRPPAVRPSGRPVPAAPVDAGPEPSLAEPSFARAAPRAPGRDAECADCAVVESIRPVAAGDGPRRAGAFAGGVAGAVFGERIGQAHERHVSRVLGTLGNVVSGRAFRRGGAAPVRHEVVLRAPDGTTRLRVYDAAPPFQPGDTVRLGAGVAVDAEPASARR